MIGNVCSTQPSPYALSEISFDSMFDSALRLKWNASSEIFLASFASRMSLTNPDWDAAIDVVGSFRLHFSVCRNKLRVMIESQQCDGFTRSIVFRVGKQYPTGEFGLFFNSKQGQYWW